MEGVLRIIHDHLVPDEMAKKERGEVFTPPELVREMLFGLRKSSIKDGHSGEIWGINEKGEFFDDDESNRIGGIPTEVWQNPDLKWLDPANGIGNFPIIAFYKLDYELSKLKKFTDTDVRQKHIIENMLYMLELDQKNVGICRNLFRKIHPGAKPNLCCADSLQMTDERLETAFGVNRFDIIMGNPPYNKGGIRTKISSHVGVISIWPTFIIHYLTKLRYSGRMVMITPNTWIELKSDVSRIMMEKQIEYLRTFNVMDALKLFGSVSGEIPLSIFVIKNEPPTQSTLIYDDITVSEFDIYKYNFIPSRGIGIIDKLLKKCMHHGNIANKYINTTRKDHTETQSKEYIYPLIKISYENIHISYTNKCGNGHGIAPKLVFPNFSMGYPILDKIGLLDTPSNMLFLLYGFNVNTLMKYQKLFYTDVILYIINTLKTKQKFLSSRIFSLIPDISDDPSFPSDITNESLYKYFGFNKNDIAQVESYKIGGEGRLSELKRNEFISFRVENIHPGG